MLLRGANAVGYTNYPDNVIYKVIIEGVHCYTVPKPMVLLLIFCIDTVSDYFIAVFRIQIQGSSTVDSDPGS